MAQVDDFNTTIQVIFRPLGQLQGTPPVEILKLMVPTIQRVAKDFVFVDEIQETKISELNAAYMKAQYTMSNQENRSFNVVSRMMVIPRGAYMFMISMSCKADATDNAEAMLDSMLKSIKIEK
ncbi:hypothetical protein JXQ70_13825 [bacterium]|nr:hypothetical protein [bacterium]